MICIPKFLSPKPIMSPGTILLWKNRVYRVKFSWVLDHAVTDLKTNLDRWIPASETENIKVLKFPSNDVHNNC